MRKAEERNHWSEVSNGTERGTKVALWWLRHYEGVVHFWTGFSWVWVIGILLAAVAGHLDLRRALCLILLIGIIANCGIYLGIKTLACYLRDLKDGREKEEAHELMAKIIRRRILHAG